MRKEKEMIDNLITLLVMLMIPCIPAVAVGLFIWIANGFSFKNSGITWR